MHRIRRAKITPTNVLASFDVVNCFSNIPTELAIDLIVRDYNKIAAVSTIPMSLFLELLRFCLHECNFFKYEQLMYRQKVGLFMGSSLAPILVERVIEDAIQYALNKVEFTPDFWYIYVDDNATSIPELHAQQMLDALNSYHERVQFTMELQENDQLNFLDMSLIKKGSTIHTKWYHKPIASNRMLNYYSAHPLHTKKNTARAFVNRAFSLTSHKFHTDVRDKIAAILEKNNFPRKMINDLIHAKQNANRSVMNATHGNNSLNITQMNDTTQHSKTILKERKQYSAMTYIPTVSESLKKNFQYFAPDISLALRPPNKNAKFFTNLKSRLGKMEKSGCVYKVECADCDCVYVGETKQKLGERMKQHAYDVSKEKTTTALADHATQTRHSFKFDDVSILCREKNKQRLRLQEVNHIIRNEDHACNFKKDSASINPIYYSMLKQD